MNQSYRLVWSAVRGAWAVVSELAKSHAKSGATMVVAAVSATMPVYANPVPISAVSNTVNVASGYYVGDPAALAFHGGAVIFAQNGNFDLYSTGSPVLQVNNSSMTEGGLGGGLYVLENTFGYYSAIEIKNKGLIDLSKAKTVILDTGNRWGIYASDNSIANISNFTFTQKYASTKGLGFYADLGSRITINRLDFTTNQNGVFATDLGTTINIGNKARQSKMAITGDTLVGMVAKDNATINLYNTNLSTSGNNSKGIDVAGGTLFADGVTITTNGNNAVGIDIKESSSLFTNGLKTVGTVSIGGILNVVSKGDDSVGVRTGGRHGLYTNHNTVNGLALNITTEGARSVGLLLDADAQSRNETIKLGSVNISVKGDDSIGMKSSSTTYPVIMNSKIYATGDNSIGLFLDSNATLKYIMSSTFSGTGLNSDAIVLEGAEGLQRWILGGKVESNRNAVLLKSGVMDLQVSSADFKGNIVANAGARLDLTISTGSDNPDDPLKVNTLLTGGIKGLRNVSMANTKWSITSNSDAQAFTNNGSNIRFVNADGSDSSQTYSDFKTLTVKNYTGSGAAANIHMNVRLNGDDIEGLGSDKVVVTSGGKMSGKTTFNFKNVGGAGVMTIDGIKFVDAQGTATVDKSQMKIAGGYVTAGAYAYVGRQGLATGTTDKQSLFLVNQMNVKDSIENGFIVPDGRIPSTATASLEGSPTATSRMTKMLSPVAFSASLQTAEASSVASPVEETLTSVTPSYSLVPSETPSVASVVVEASSPVALSVALDDSVVAASTAPVMKTLYSADFVTYNAIADVVSLSANTLLGTYQERMGAQNMASVSAEKSSSWGRFVADTREVAYDNAAFNQSIQGETMGFQLGHSLLNNRNQNNSLSQAGLAVGYVTGNMDVSGDFAATINGKAGSIDADTTSLAGYYTLATDDGRYLDAMLQYSWSKSKASGQQSNVSLKSTGLRGSFEVGAPVRYDSLTVEPQAQLVVYKDSFDSALDSKGYEMSQGDNSGVIARFGARFMPNDSDAAFKPWLAANVNLQNASGKTGVMDNTSNVGLNSEKDAKWADMSVGMTYQTSSDFSVYGHLKQSVAIGGGTNTTTSGAIGIQKTW